MPCFALSVSQRKDAYLVFLLHWMETITLTLLRKWAILTVLVLVPRQRTIVCVCAYVCPPFLHLKETPKEKLNNTLPLTKSIKQLCPHVFLDLKVLYLNSFQIMSKKKKNDVTVYVGSHKGLYLFHTIQIVSREFFLLISWRVSLTTGLCSLSLTAWKVKVFSAPSPKKVKWSVKQSQINK